MKTIGIIGGMSWESSAEYYRLLNRHAKARLGGHHNASSLLLTVDFATSKPTSARATGTHLARRWPAPPVSSNAAARNS